MGTLANTITKMLFFFILLSIVIKTQRLKMQQPQNNLTSKSNSIIIPFVPILLFLWVIMSILWSYDSNYNIIVYWLMFIFEILPIFLFLCTFPFDTIMRETERGLILGGIAVCIVAIYAGFSYTGRLGNEEFFHPNIIGNLTSISLLAYFSHVGRKDRINVPDLIVGGLLLSVLFLTISKTAILAFIIAFISLIFAWQKVDSLKRGFAFILFLLVLICFIYIFFSEYIYKYFNSYLFSEKFFKTLTGRTLIWDISIQLIRKKWLIGYGFMAYRNLVGDKLFHVRIGSAHNDFLNVMFNFGLIGLLLYVYVLFIYFVDIIKTFKYINKSNYLDLIICLFIYFIVRGLTEGNLTAFNFLMPLLILNVSYLKNIKIKKQQ